MSQKKRIIDRIRSAVLRYSPPGYDSRIEVRFYIIGNIIAFTVSLLFFASYASERIKLYDYDRVLKKYVLNETKTMADFTEVLNGYLLGFVFLAVIMLTFTVFRYSYYRQGSRSIYLMKRLPRKNEIHKRALPSPITAFCSCLIYALVLRILYFVLYVILTPNKCMPAGLGEQLWRIFG